jgi:hypothetical protein
MKKKLVVLSLVVICLACLNWPINGIAVNGHQTSNALADQIELTPLKVGSFERTEPHWHIVGDDGTVEEGSMYALKSAGTKPTSLGNQVQLDFYRAHNRRHNGLSCYIGRGEILLWTHALSLKVNKQNIQVALGLTQTDRQLRLTAATECYANGCYETPLETKWGVNFSPTSPLYKYENEPKAHGKGIVPMSVVITADFDEMTRSQVEVNLLAQMDNFLDSFDFSSVKKLASLQD